MSSRYGRHIATPESAASARAYSDRETRQRESDQAQAEERAEQREYKRAQDKEQDYDRRFGRATGIVKMDRDAIQYRADQAAKEQAILTAETRHKEGAEGRRLDDALKQKTLDKQPTWKQESAEISPIDSMRIINDFREDWQFKEDSQLDEEYQKNPERINEAILYGVSHGMTLAAIAKAIGKDVEMKPTVKPAGGVSKFFGGKDEVLRDDPVDPYRRITPPGGGIMQREEAQPQPQAPAAPPPQDTPEEAKARVLVTEFKRRHSEDPNWVYTLHPEVLERVKAAGALLQGAGQPARGGIVPQQEAPAPGRVLPDSAALRDVNGDGQVDDSDLQMVQSQYESSLDRVARFDAFVKANPTAVIPPSVRAQASKSRMIVDTYNGVFKKRAGEGIAGVLNKQ